MQGVLSPKTAGRNPLPVHFTYRDRVLIAPSRDGIRDIDDLFTIRIAMQNEPCQFVDNDNYRDDRYGSILDEATLSFLHRSFHCLHVEYIFDSNGNFCPMREPL